MPTREQITNYIEMGRAQGIPDEELMAQVRHRIAATRTLTRTPAEPSTPIPGDDPGTAALRKATGIGPLTTQQHITDLMADISGKVIAPAAEVGLPLAAAFLTRGTGALGAAGIQAAAAGAGSLLGQGVREPGKVPSLERAALPTALAGLGTLAAGGIGGLLTRAGGAGKEATRQVMQRGTVGGRELAFNFDPNAEARALDGMRRLLQNPPLTGGRKEINAILKSAAKSGVRVKVIPTVDRLANALGVQPREAFLTPPQKIEVTRPSAILKESGQPFRVRTVEEIPRQQGIRIVGEPRAVGADKLSAQKRMDVLARRLLAEADDAGTISITRFEEILQGEITKPTVRIGGKLEPSLQESTYIQALRQVKKDTIQDLASGLESEGGRFIRARVAARREMTAMEGLRKRLFTRDRAGNLQPRENAIPTLRTIFKRAETGDDTLLRMFQEFDEITGAGITPHLRELSLRQSLSAEDRTSLIVVDGVVRTMSGLRSGLAELARAGARSVGKSLQVAARPIGAAAGIVGQKLTEKPPARLKIQRKEEKKP